MIRAFLIINRAGRPRFLKFYDNDLSEFQKQNFVIDIYLLLMKRVERSCSIIDTTNIYKNDASETKLIYKLYGSLFLGLIVDKFENDLLILDVIQLFLQCLQKLLDVVTEYEIISENEMVLAIVDQIICGGIVIETNVTEICTQVKAQKVIANKNSNVILKQAQMKLKNLVIPLADSIKQKIKKST